MIKSPGRYAPSLERRPVKSLCAAVVLGLVSGCATTTFAPPDVSRAAVQSAEQEIDSTVRGPKYVSDDDASQRIYSVYHRVAPVARSVCQQLQEHDTCNWHLRVEKTSEFNAYADGENNVVINTGLVSYMRSDDELAAVIAHELMHVATDHLAESEAGAVTGAIVGGILMGSLVAATSNGYTSAQSASDSIESAVYAGAWVGGESYSKSQEREADYLAAYVIHQAGLDLRKAGNVFVSMGAMGSQGGGMFDTHPATAERVANWEAVTAEIEMNGNQLDLAVVKARAEKQQKARVNGT